MNYKIKTSSNIKKPNIINSDIVKDIKNSRLQEVASILKMGILRIRLREKNKLIKEIL
jgi:hypothetical protein